MRLIILSLLLLPFAANAEPFDRKDCEFVKAYFHSCKEVGYGIGSGSMAHQYQSFDIRHPYLGAMGEPLAKICDQVRGGELTEYDAYHTACSDNPETEED